ncbi:putative cytosol aminopeptidase [Catellatospora sp. TT07R-123]|uniref:leucyl aminopeptidase n=1 Tax=Catellatospora sp. TT07R-123 TaxID=2733863 RepID=UPI001B2D40E9|nr:leucyl aminopeptidase [Catellatospora sp. TT07R-123]GHJ45078.1 putative cytosol aminopeptidase [Catellatospora sp. TT07R-123]
MTTPTTALPTLSLADTDPADLTVDAVVIGVHSQDGAEGAGGELLLASGAESIAAAFDGKLTATLAALGATGGAGEVTKVATFGTIAAPVLVAVGLGAEPVGAAPAPDTLRRATAAAVRALAGAKKVALALPLSDDAEDTGAPALRAVAEGAALGAYRFAGYKAKPAPTRKDPVSAVSVLVPDAKEQGAQGELKRAAVVTTAVARTRDWVNAPANLLRPPNFADEIAEAAAKAGLEVEVLDEQDLIKGGFGGVLAVGMGSAAKPRLVKLTYTPASSTKSVALVGKGITFDTGGVSIKPPQGMWEMKSDMAGAAAVASTMIALAELKPAVAVSAYIPIAENMLSGEAYRPGDVITMRGGKKVEVLNTDAEGRMVLADAITLACESNPDYLVETSTLTGGQVVALGKKISGVMGSDALAQRVKTAGEVVGEPTWPMPLPDDVRKTMESDVADILQVSAGMERAGHMLQGGVFLREFVGEGVEWVHIDIAGPSFHSGEPTGHWSKGGTGVPVRTLLALLDDIVANG